MAERQKHGFEYEKLIIEKFNLEKEEKYTSKWDGYEMYNGQRIPVSIKCIGVKSSIDFGDFFRQIDVETDFILHVGFWSSQKNNIVEEYRVLIKKEKWHSYFGNKEIYSSMLSELKEISNDKIDDQKWKSYREKYKSLYGDSIVSLRFKRDHKKQKRIQCGIARKNFDLVLKENIILNHLYPKSYNG